MIDLFSKNAKGVFWPDTGEESAWLLCVRTKMTLYDVTSQEHSSLLPCRSVQKQTTFSAGYERKRESGFLFSTNQRRTS